MHGSTPLCSNPVSLKAQRGVSLTGLIVVLGLIIAMAMLALKVVPFLLEYNAAKAAIASAKSGGGTPAEIRSAFNSSADVNDIDSVTATDLIITKVGDKNEVAFDYDVKIALFTDVHLGVRFAATTDSSGVIPEKPEKTTTR